MSLVVDATVTLAWAFHEERRPAVLEVLDAVLKQGAVVPASWRLDVANGLQAAMRHGRIDRAFRDQTLADLAQFPITIDSETNAHAWSSALALGETFGLTPYDAAYLELAHRGRMALATLDGRLREAASRMGVPTRGR